MKKHTTLGRLRALSIESKRLVLLDIDAFGWQAAAWFAEIYR